MPRQKNKFKENAVVFLKGVVVHVYDIGKTYEVEFPNTSGKPLILTLDESQLEDNYNGWADK